MMSKNALASGVIPHIVSDLCLPLLVGFSIMIDDVWERLTIADSRQ